MPKSASKGGKKGKDKMASKRNAVTDLTEQNETLLKEKELLQQEVSQSTGKLSAIVHKLVDSLTENARLKRFHIANGMDPMKVCILLSLFGIVDLRCNMQFPDFLCGIFSVIRNVIVAVT